MQVMQDPSQGIHRDLLHHVHLLSTYRFPNTPSQLHPERVAEWLLNAPKITRDQAPVYWTYLDRPVDGTVLLSWQTPTLGHEFPSDGYIWAPGETAFSMEVMGCTLEIYQCKIGYATGESIASHSRRRYRILPPRIPNQNPLPDPNLWIIHYIQAPPEDRLPSHIIPINQQIQTIMSTRQYLHQQGQLIHKEFLLHDRANWAKIDFPRGHPRGAPMYAASIPPRVPQSMAYPTHPQPGPPPKRARTAVSQAAAANNTTAVVEEDEEENSRGDWFDLTTPREISYSRFLTNYDWMEEVLSSPYAIHQIVPTDLGLGVRGELNSLTEGIFNAPLKENEEPTPALNYVGRLDPGKAEEFRKRAHDTIAQTNKDIEKIKAKHAKRLAKFQRGSLISQAEKELRTAVDDPSDVGPEYWRLEGKIDEEENEDTETPIKVPSKVDDVLAKVEASLGRHAVAISELRRIQDGGYEEVAAQASPQPSRPSRNGSQQSGVLINESDVADVDMTNSTAGLLDQFHNSNPSSSHATPMSANYPTPGHLQHPSAATTPAGALHMASPHLSQTMGTPQAAQHQFSPQQEQQDIHMQDSISTAEAHQSMTATAQPTGDTSDWVVIPPGGVSPTADPSNTNTNSNTPNPQSHDQQSALPDYLKPSSNNTPEQTTNSTSLPEPQVEHSQEQEEQEHHTELNENDFDLEDLDTAGDALASYDADDNMEDDGHGLGDLVDDSAFGEAFHGIDHDHGDTDGDNQGM